MSTSETKSQNETERECSCSKDLPVQALIENLFGAGLSLDDFKNLDFDNLTNSTANSTAKYDTTDDIQSLVRLMRYTMSTGSVIMNSLSIVAIAFSNSAMSPNVRLITSLALSDVLCGVCGFLDDPSVAGIDTCSRRAVKCLIVIAHLTALLTILGLAVDHYLAICRPFYHRSDDNVLRVTFIIVLIWIISCTTPLVDVIAGVNNVFLTCVSHTARVIDAGRLSVTVSLSVCPSHAGIVSKRLNLSSNCLHYLVAP